MTELTVAWIIISASGTTIVENISSRDACVNTIAWMRKRAFGTYLCVPVYFNGQKQTMKVEVEK